MKQVKKMAFINSKGGCGKSTGIFHFSGLLSKDGQKVLVIDFDKQRNTTFTMLLNANQPDKTVYDVMLGREPGEAVAKAMFKSRGNALPKYYGVDCMVSDEQLADEGKLRNIDGADFSRRLESFVEERQYDWVLVDMPPSNLKLNEICFNGVVNNLVIPFSSDLFSIQGYESMLKMIKSAKSENPKLKNLGVYLSRYMNGCGLDAYVREKMQEIYPESFIDIQIPLATDVREAVFFGRPLCYYKSEKSSKSLQAYMRLAEYIKDHVDGDVAERTV